MRPRDQERTRLARDLERYTHDGIDVSWRTLASTAFREPGFLAVWLYRTQCRHLRKGRLRWASFVRWLTLAITGADLVPGSEIDGGLVIRHPVGVVIGAGADVGADCTILQQVTLGALDAAARGRQSYPRIGRSVVIGAGAKVLGAVQVGDGARIGANAVVLRDVPAGATAIGVPAVIRTGRSTDRADYN